MPSFTGRFEYLAPGRGPVDAGPCEVSFDEQTLTLVGGGGPSFACDLGDIDVLEAGDYDLRLTVYTGHALHLTHVGAAFANLALQLRQAYRDRLVRCLLVSDLQEVARFAGVVSPGPCGGTGGGPAEIRLYDSNLAILPDGAAGFQWRLAEIDGVEFDERQYCIVLTRGPDRLTIGRLAKRTGELAERLKDGMAGLAERSARALHALLPFLSPDQFRQVSSVLREGACVPVAGLRSVHRLIESAVLDKAVDARLRPYVAALAGRCTPEGWYTGFKIVRRGADDSAADPAPEAGGDVPADDLSPGTDVASPVTEPESGLEVLYWFFFPLAATAGPPATHAAWEATSRSGRATYLFGVKAGAPVGETIAAVNRGLVALNFRREPIYLGADVLESDIRYRHYAIALRKVPELGRVRGSFVGRVIHTALPAWTGQLDTLLRGA